MVYIANDSELRLYLASIQCLKTLPDVVVIDDFQLYFKPNIDKSYIYMTMAVIRDTGDYIVSVKNHEDYISNSKPLGILVGDQYTESGSKSYVNDPNMIKKRFEIYGRWFPVQLIIPIGKKPYELTVMQNRHGETHQGKLSYSIGSSQNCIVFHMLSFNNIEIMLE